MSSDDLFANNPNVRRGLAVNTYPSYLTARRQSAQGRARHRRAHPTLEGSLRQAGSRRVERQPRLDSTPMQEPSYADTWVVLPTYDEIDNLEGIATAILERLPGRHAPGGG